MATLHAFKTFAQTNMMALEAIIAELYTARAAGLMDFALFDGGAHKGYHTRRMLQTPGCRAVYAVEADPFMAAGLRTALEAALVAPRPRLHLIEKALQNDPGVTEIPWKSSHSHVGRSSIVSCNADRSTIWRDHADIGYRDQMTVPATTIDTILTVEQGPLPFIKLDLEGADLMALTGAAATLRHHRPLIAFENSIHAPEVHGFTLNQITAWFQSLDYVAVDFVGDLMDQTTWFGFFEAFAVPRADLNWLQQRLAGAVARVMQQTS